MFAQLGHALALHKAIVFTKEEAGKPGPEMRV